MGSRVGRGKRIHELGIYEINDRRILELWIGEGDGNDNSIRNGTRI